MVQFKKFHYLWVVTFQARATNSMPCIVFDSICTICTVSTGDRKILLVFGKWLSPPVWL